MVWGFEPGQPGSRIFNAQYCFLQLNGRMLPLHVAVLTLPNAIRVKQLKDFLISLNIS